MTEPDQQSSSPIGLAIVGENPGDISLYVAAVGTLREEGELMVVTATTLDSGPHRLDQADGSMGPRLYDSLGDLLVAEDLDGVVVASSLERRAGHVADVLEYSHHVLVETPTATSRATAEEACRIAEELDLMLVPANALRIVPAVRAARDALQRGAIGRPGLFVAGRAGDWDGVGVAQLAPLLDLARSLMGNVAGIRAVTGDGDSSMLVDLHFASGLLGSLSLMASHERCGWMHIGGDRGHVRADLVPRMGSGGDSRPIDLLTGLIRNFVHAIQGLESPLAGAWDGPAVAELVAAACLSLESGGVVGVPLDAAGDLGPP